jgi:hypothetical protein
MAILKQHEVDWTMAFLNYVAQLIPVGSPTDRSLDDIKFYLATRVQRLARAANESTLYSLAPDSTRMWI